MNVNSWKQCDAILYHDTFSFHLNRWYWKLKDIIPLLKLFCLSPFYVLWGLNTKKWLQINIKTMEFVVEAFLSEYYIIHFMRIILQFTPCHNIIDSSHISCFGLGCSRLKLFCQATLEFKLEITHIYFWWLYRSIWNCRNNNNLRGSSTCFRRNKIFSFDVQQQWI